MYQYMRVSWPRARGTGSMPAHPMFPPVAAIPECRASLEHDSVAQPHGTVPRSRILDLAIGLSSIIDPVQWMVGALGFEALHP